MFCCNDTAAAHGPLPADRAGSCRFVNHSCDPNLAVLCVRDRPPPARPRLAFFARRDIAAGEELSISYSDAPRRPKDPDGTAEAAAVGTVRTDDDGTVRAAAAGRAAPRRCLCGAASCRGTLPFDDDSQD